MKNFIKNFVLIFPFLVMFFFSAMGIVTLLISTIGILMGKGTDLLKIEYILLLGFAGIIAALYKEK